MEKGKVGANRADRDIKAEKAKAKVSTFGISTTTMEELIMPEVSIKVKRKAEAHGTCTC